MRLESIVISASLHAEDTLAKSRSKVNPMPPSKDLTSKRRTALPRFHPERSHAGSIDREVLALFLMGQLKSFRP
jgi:hypothetical protein